MKLNQVIYTIHHNSCITAACSCNDVVYDVNDENGQTVGSLTKYWAGGLKGCAGCCREMSNADTFVIDIPENASNRQKTALIGAQLLMV